MLISKGHFGIGIVEPVDNFHDELKAIKQASLYRRLRRVENDQGPTLMLDGREVVTPTLALSVLNGQREGNFPLRPNARLNDGLFDFMHATRLGRGHLLRYLPAMVRGTLP